MSRGRKTIDKDKINKIITLRLTEEEFKKIEELAKIVDLPKTRFMRNVLLAGLEEAEMLNKIGALKGAKKIIDFKERFFNTEKYTTLQHLGESYSSR